MPFTVKDLIEGRAKPIVVQHDDSALRAIELMIEHDFSQLPVVDRDEKPLGMVTSDSILRALNHFGITINALRASDAIIRAYDFPADEDIFELLDELRDINAVLIIDNEGRLTGIVTSYDTTEYFRRRAEDIMLVEDIENTLKDYIVAAFTSDSGEIDQAALDAAIEEITPSNKELRKQFQQALRHYLEQQNADSANIIQELAEDAFLKFLDRKEPPKSFDMLSLYDYTELFLHRSRWPIYSSVFTLDPQAIRTLLKAVRETRNALAHFRAEITPKQRDELRFCKDWLGRHQNDVLKLLSKGIIPSIPISVNQEVKDTASNDSAENEITPVGEEVAPSDSRYAPLAIWLQNQSSFKVELTFEDIEAIIGGPLPKFARKHRSWWANDSVGHIQSQQWLNAGWRVSSINLFEERVIFDHIGTKRERAYIDFFSVLLKELREAAPFQVKDTSPAGYSWITIASLPERERQVAVLSFTFSAKKKFRIELYIKTRYQDINKRIFDELYNRNDEIESAIGWPLSWERMDSSQASRIALYHDGDIASDEGELTKLREWAVATMISFYQSINGKFCEALKKVSESSTS